MNDQSTILLAQVDIVEVIAKYIKLEKLGENYRSKCPFHADQDPSFSISTKLNIFKCFGAGCGRGGNVANFIQYYEDISYHEALSHLAKLIDKPHLAPTLKPQNFSSVLEINKLASQLYNDVLFTKSEVSEKARANLRERRITQDTAKLFGIGYSPNSWTWLVEQQAIVVDDLLKSGLIMESDAGHYRDFFKNRLIFPLYYQKNIVGFTGRTLGVAKKIPKYLNSRDSDWFKKQDILYGLDVTRNHIRQSKHAVLVEGQFDVIQLYQRGIQNAIAVSGSYFGGKQAKFISSFVDRVTIFSDGDKAGVDSSIRIGEYLIANDIKVNIIYLEGKDPDEAAKYSHRFDWDKLNTKYSSSFPAFAYKHLGLEGALKRAGAYSNSLELSYALRELSELSGYDEKYIERWLLEFKKSPLLNQSLEDPDNQLKLEEELLLFSTQHDFGINKYLEKKLPKILIERMQGNKQELIIKLAENPKYISRLLMINNIDNKEKYIKDLIIKVNLQFMKRDVRKFKGRLKDTGDIKYLSLIEQMVKRINKLKLGYKHGRASE
jgi:DNA primase catalytic core